MSSSSTSSLPFNDSSFYNLKSFSKYLNHSSLFYSFPIHPPSPASMTVRANKFTPEVMLSAPRRSSAVPNSDGTLALFTVTTYSFDSHSKSSEIRVLDLGSGQSKVLTDDLAANEPVWLGELNLVLWLKGGEKGTTKLILGDAGFVRKSVYHS